MIALIAGAYLGFGAVWVLSAAVRNARQVTDTAAHLTYWNGEVYTAAVIVAAVLLCVVLWPLDVAVAAALRVRDRLAR